MIKPHRSSSISSQNGAGPGQPDHLGAQPYPPALRVNYGEADSLSPEDAEAILKVLRPIARAHPAGRNPADPGIRMLRSDLRRVAREVVRRPGYALRILILAIEEEGQALCGNEDGGCRTRLQNGRNAFCGGEGR